MGRVNVAVRFLLFAAISLFGSLVALAEYEQEYVLTWPPAELDGVSFSFEAKSGEILPVRVSEEWSSDERTVLLIAFPGNKSGRGTLLISKNGEETRHTIIAVGPGQVLLIDPDERRTVVADRRELLPGKKAPGPYRGRNRGLPGVEDRGLYGRIELGTVDRDLTTGGGGSVDDGLVVRWIAEGASEVNNHGGAAMVGYNLDRPLFGWKKTSDLRLELDLGFDQGDTEDTGGSGTSYDQRLPEAGWVQANGEPVSRGGYYLGADLPVRLETGSVSVSATWNQGAKARRLMFLPRITLSYGSRRQAFTTSIPDGLFSRTQELNEKTWGLGAGATVALDLTSRWQMRFDLAAHLVNREATLDTHELSRWSELEWDGTEWGPVRPPVRREAMIQARDEDSGGTYRWDASLRIGLDVSNYLHFGLRVAHSYLNETASIVNPVLLIQGVTPVEPTHLATESAAATGFSLYLEF